MGTHVKTTNDVFVENGLGVYELGDWELGEDIFEDVPAIAVLVEDGVHVVKIKDGVVVSIVEDTRKVVQVRDGVHVELS